MSICKETLRRQHSENLSECSYQFKGTNADLVRTYLGEIGRIPLLTHEQEIAYGKQVQKMMSLLSAKETLVTKLNREPMITEWAEYVQLPNADLNHALQQGKRAKQKMIEANLRLVVAIAKHYQKRDLEFLDLIQEGAVGLMRGVEKFDPTRGYKFSTCAYWWIRQAITRALATQSRAIRLPIHVIEKLNKIKKVQRELSQKLGRTSKVFEVAAELQLTPKQVRKYLEQAQKPVSLNLCVGDEQDTELGELLEESGKTPEQFVTQSELVKNLAALMAELTPQQREVLELRYGLLGGEGITLAQIGRKLNLSRERVRQIELKALNILRARRSQIGHSCEVSVDYGFEEAIALAELSSEFADFVQLDLFSLREEQAIACPQSLSIPA